MREKLEELLTSQFSGQEFGFSEFRDELTLTVPSGKIVEICDFLKHEPAFAFTRCVDISAIDYATRNNRFAVVYHLFSLDHAFRLRVITVLDGDPAEVDSVTSVWASADWAERETYDMYGIHFNNHPDLRRMYMPEEFEYHPLRKDFPLMGIPGSLPLPKK